MTLNALKLFDMDRAVPPGAVNYEARRLYGAGEAIVFLGGGDIPEVALGQATMTRDLKFLVTSYSETIRQIIKESVKA